MPLRIICAHNNNIHPKTAEAIAKYAPETEFVETKGIWGYNEVIASRWTGESDLVVIEQDKEITAEVIPSFEACNQDWCAFSYDVLPPPYTKLAVLGLGCTRYSANAQKLISPRDFLDKDFSWPGYPVCPDCNGKGCWRYLDSRIAFALMHALAVGHVHGKINHYHEYPPDWAKQKGLE